MAEGKLSKDQERLAKLWDAYEIQEKEFELSLKKIATMEHKIEELNRVNNVLKKAMEDRDKEIRDLELKVVTLEEQNSKYEPQVKEINRLYQEEKSRYAKLFTITEELEEELARAKKESEIKDKWFERNVGMLENLRESIVTRNKQLTEMEKEGISITTQSATEATSIETELKSTPEPPSTSNTEENKDVTFKPVTLEKEPEKIKEPSSTATSTEAVSEPAPSEPGTPSTSETSEASKNETIYEFTKIPNVDPLIAESLYNSGYSSMDKLKSATTEDLAKIDGISPTLARKIRTNLFEMGQ